MHRTNKTIHEQIVISYAGSRAEEMIYGDFAVGSHSDHQRASDIINGLLNGGLAVELSLLSPAPFHNSGLIPDEIQRRALEVAERQAKEGQRRATEIVEANRAAIESFAARLLDLDFIDGSTLREVSGPALQALIVECGFQCAPDRDPE